MHWVSTFSALLKSSGRLAWILLALVLLKAGRFDPPTHAVSGLVPPPILGGVKGGAVDMLVVE